MYMHYNELWNRVLNVPGAFEFKEAIVLQAGRAIKELDINILYDAISTFNPDHPEDGVTEYSNDAITKFVREHDVENYVKARIDEKQKK